MMTVAMVMTMAMTIVMTMYRWNNLWHAKASLGRVGSGGAAVVDWVVRVRQLSIVILGQVLNIFLSVQHRHISSSIEYHYRLSSIKRFLVESTC